MRTVLVAIGGAILTSVVASTAMLALSILLAGLSMAGPKTSEFDDLGVGAAALILVMLAAMDGALAGIVLTWLRVHRIFIRRWLWVTAVLTGTSLLCMAVGVTYMSLQVMSFMLALLVAGVMLPVASASGVHALLARRAPQ